MLVVDKDVEGLGELTLGEVKTEWVCTVAACCSSDGRLRLRVRLQEFQIFMKLKSFKQSNTGAWEGLGMRVRFPATAPFLHLVLCCKEGGSGFHVCAPCIKDCKY